VDKIGRDLNDHQLQEGCKIAFVLKTPRNRYIRNANGNSRETTRRDS
jgi:hypothetical protein